MGAPSLPGRVKCHRKANTASSHIRARLIAGSRFGPMGSVPRLGVFREAPGGKIGTPRGGFAGLPWVAVQPWSAGPSSRTPCRGRPG